MDNDYMKGMSEDEYADWARSLQKSVGATLCECNGGPPCACPDCDHEDCGYKNKYCTCDAVIPPQQRDVESDLHESHCKLYRP